MEKKVKNLITVLMLIFASIVFGETWECEIHPSEQKIEIDPSSGAKIIFATTNPASDNNLYFHDRCFLFDNKMMVFYSDRTGRQEIWGYLADTGELVRLNNPDASAASSALASRTGNKIYVSVDKSIREWKIDLTAKSTGTVKITERKICDLPVNAQQLSGLNENSDFTLVSFGYKIGDVYYIAVVNVNTGEITTVVEVDFYIQHIQFHWHRPDILSFARGYESDTAPLDPNEPAHARLWFVNINTKTPVPAFFQRPGELVTHECWWVNDQITFIGGHNPQEAHMKVLNITTGEIRIVGSGSWWQGAEAAKISQYNWWHGSGSPDGRWVAADNWHGIIAIFDAKTTEKRIISSGNRIYGGGPHPHVGWDLTGDAVEFTSNIYGNADVCIGVIPEEWK
jgi:hypothetical protein